MKRMLAIGLVCGLAGPAIADDKDDAELAALIQKRDAAGFAKHARSSLQVVNLFLASGPCAEFSGKSTRVESSRYPALVECLAGAGLRVENGDVVQEPGIRVAFRVRDGLVDMIASFVFTEGPLVTPAALHRHLPGGVLPEIQPPAAVRTELAKSPVAVAYEKFGICIAATGAVESVTIYKRDDDPQPSYAPVVETAVKAWKVAPFKLGGTAVRVCTVDAVSWPPGRAVPGYLLAPPPPGPPPPPRPPGPDDAVEPDKPVVSPDPPFTVPPEKLEELRVAGEKNIVPDDATKEEIARAKVATITGRLEMCVAGDGGFSSVLIVRSTGYPAYDAKLLREIKRWRFKPFMVNGKAHRVCTTLIFVFAT